jgi:CBS domain-containing protein
LLEISTPARPAKEEAMSTLRARDIMTTDILALHAGDSIADAARALTARRISGAPVLDGSRIVGVVSKSDLVDPKHWLDDATHTTVGAVMTRVLYAVRPGDPVMSAVRLMVEQKVHRAVVVTEDGALAGIVTSMDVLRALAQGNCVQEGDFAFDSQRGPHSEPAVAVGYVDLQNFELRP